MRRLVIPALAVATLALAGLTAPQPAAASSRWFAGADFAVGGIQFSLGYFDGFGPGHPQRHYYRTHHRLSYSGHQCGSACYITDGYHYHDRFCPVVRHHFGHYRYDPYLAWGHLERGSFVYWGSPYRYSPHRSYRSWRPDPRWDHRRDRRWDRHDRRDHRRDDRWDRSDRRHRDDDRDRRGNGRSDRRRSRDDD